jgi:SNF2 family DNA or RNA helicase
VLVLPEKQEIRVDVPLSASGMRAYKSMLRDSQVEIAKQIEQASLSVASYQEVIHTVSAMNGGIRFLRLLQLAQGYANDENGEEVQTDTEKRRALLDMLEQTDEPVCVYGWFKHDLKTVRDCCEILGRSYGEVSGVRKDLTDRGTMPEVDVLGVQCKSGNSGIDLTRARIAIVLNTGTMSPGDYDQMLARQYRPGQTRGVVYYHLVTPGTVDEYAYTARQEKRDVVDAILRGIVPDEWAELEGRFSCLAS